MDVVDNSLMVHPSLGVKFLVVGGIAIEFRPYADHKAATLGMNTIKHCLRIRIARRLKLMRAPLVLHPVVPVLHDIVARNLALAELIERADYLIGSLVTFATLPETQHPLRIDGSLARQRTIARDDLVGILARNEVVVHVLCHLTPDGELALVLMRLDGTQTAIAHVAIGTPFYTELLALTLTHQLAEFIRIGVPGRTPTLGHHLLTAYIYLNISRIIENEVILAIFGCLDKALVNHVGTIETNVLRQILDTAKLRTVGNFRRCRTVELEIDGILLAHQRLAVLIGIGSRQVSFPTLLVVDLESTAQLLVVLRITETAVAVRIPQQTIVLSGQHERHADLGVILEQVLVQALHIQLLRLVLAQTVERLFARIAVAVEQQVPRQTVTLGLGNLRHVDTNLAIRHAERLESLAVLSLLQQLLAIGIVESDSSRLLIHASLDIGSLHADPVAIRHRELRFRRLWDDDQALLLRQLCLGCRLHADDVVVHYLQAHHLCTACLYLLYGNGHILTLGRVVSSHHSYSHTCQHSRRDCSNKFHFVVFLFSCFTQLPQPLPPLSPVERGV